MAGKSSHPSNLDVLGRVQNLLDDAKEAEETIRTQEAAKRKAEDLIVAATKRRKESLDSIQYLVAVNSPVSESASNHLDDYEEEEDPKVIKKEPEVIAIDDTEPITKKKTPVSAKDAQIRALIYSAAVVATGFEKGADNLSPYIRRKLVDWQDAAANRRELDVVWRIYGTFRNVKPLVTGKLYKIGDFVSNTWEVAEKWSDCTRICAMLKNDNGGLGMWYSEASENNRTAIWVKKRNAARMEVWLGYEIVQ